MSCLFFATSNPYKFSEFARLFGARGIVLEQADVALQEIQTLSLEAIARDKVLKAYASLSRPVIVDASGMSMEALKGLPQGLNRQFWDVLKDEVCDLAARLGNDRASIHVQLALCDGQRIFQVAQHIPGRIARAPATIGTFHLDRVFIPDGSGSTLAEMSEDERDRISHRTKAVDEAIDNLRRIDLGRRLGLK